MKNEVIFDNRGIPDIMVSFTPDELGLPAELKGRKVEAYLIGKYPATLISGVPHSLPYQQPAVNINHDEAIRLCEAKGPGYWPQRFNKYMQSPGYTLPALAKGART